MLIFLDLINNRADQIAPNDSTGVFVRTILATLFGFVLNEGYSILKERKRINKVGDNFTNDTLNLLDSLKKQVNLISEYLPNVDPERISSSAFHLNVLAGIDPSEILKYDRLDLFKYFDRKKFKKADSKSLVNNIMSISVVVKFNFERLKNADLLANQESKRNTKSFQDALSKISRTLSNIMTEIERKGNDINQDDLFLSWHKVLKPFIENNQIYSDHTEIRNNILIPLAEVNAQFRTDERIDSMSVAAQEAFDAYLALKQGLIDFNIELNGSARAFQESSESLNEQILKFNQTQMKKSEVKGSTK